MSQTTEVSAMGYSIEPNAENISSPFFSEVIQNPMVPTSSRVPGISQLSGKCLDVCDR